MIYKAKVLRLGNDIEEEVVLGIGEVVLTCFASVCPYPIEDSAFYPVELNLVVSGSYVVTEMADDSAQSIVQIGEGFGYVVSGVLKNNGLEAIGLLFEDEVLAKDFSCLLGKRISMEVSRIDAEFL